MSDSSESKTFTLQGIDVGNVGKPPDVTFVFAEDMGSFSARPDGATIRVECVAERVSRITLTDEKRGGILTALVDVQHVAEPALKDWNDPAMYAGEVACALYWSQWRHQQAVGR